MSRETALALPVGDRCLEFGFMNSASAPHEIMYLNEWADSGNTLELFGSRSSKRASNVRSST